jgi:hypothetical protein
MAIYADIENKSLNVPVANVWNIGDIGLLRLKNESYGTESINPDLYNNSYSIFFKPTSFKTSVEKLRDSNIENRLIELVNNFLTQGNLKKLTEYGIETKNVYSVFTDFLSELISFNFDVLSIEATSDGCIFYSCKINDYSLYIQQDLEFIEDNNFTLITYKNEDKLPSLIGNKVKLISSIKDVLKNEENIYIPRFEYAVSY